MPSRQDASQRRRKSAGDRRDKTDVSKRVPLEQYFISDFILMAIHQNHNEVVVVEGGPGTDRSSALGSSENPGPGPGTGTGWIVQESQWLPMAHDLMLRVQGVRQGSDTGRWEILEVDPPVIGLHQRPGSWADYY